MAVLLLLVVVFWLLPVWVAGTVATNKGIERTTGTLLGLFLSWLGVLIVLVMPYRPGLDQSGVLICPDEHESPPGSRRCVVCGTRDLVRL